MHTKIAIGSRAWLAEQKSKVAALSGELARGQFVLFDTETTGFAPSDEIIQIGIVNQAGDVLLDTFLKPTCSITNSERHGITDAMVADAPGFPQVYEQIAALLSGRLVLAYNSEFDWTMLDQDCDRHGLARITPLATECVMELYAAFYGAWSDYHRSFTWQRLGAACKRLGIDPGQEHRAVDDCWAALAVLKAMGMWKPEAKMDEGGEQPPF